MGICSTPCSSSSAHFVSVFHALVRAQSPLGLPQVLERGFLASALSGCARMNEWYLVDPGFGMLNDAKGPLKEFWHRGLPFGCVALFLVFWFLVIVVCVRCPRQMQAQGCATSPASFAPLIHCSANCVDAHSATRFLMQMVHAKHKPSNVLCNVTLTAFSKRKDLKSAFILVEDMKKMNLRLDVIGYTTLLQGCVTDVKSARKLFDDMLANNVMPNIKNIKHHHQRLRPARRCQGKPRTILQNEGDLENRAYNIYVQFDTDGFFKSA